MNDFELSLLYDRLNRLVESGEMTEEEAIKAIRKCKFKSDMPSYWYIGMEDAQNIVKTLPSADTVEVVRCKDCKFSESVITSWSTDGKNNAVERLCKVHKWSVKDNDFCSYGERSEE